MSIKRQPLDERLLSRLTTHVDDWWWLCEQAWKEHSKSLSIVSLYRRIKNMHRLVNHCHLRMETQTMALTLHTALKKKSHSKIHLKRDGRESSSWWRCPWWSTMASGIMLPPWCSGARWSCCRWSKSSNVWVYFFFLVELGKAIYLSISSNRDLYRVMQSYAGDMCPSSFGYCTHHRIRATRRCCFFSYAQSKTKYRNHQKVKRSQVEFRHWQELNTDQVRYVQLILTRTKSIMYCMTVLNTIIINITSFGTEIDEKEHFPIVWIETPYKRISIRLYCLHCFNSTFFGYVCVCVSFLARL